jgi:hypothetical protein
MNVWTKRELRSTSVIFLVLITGLEESMSSELLEAINPLNWARFLIEEAAWLAVAGGGKIGRLGKWILCRGNLV